MHLISVIQELWHMIILPKSQNIQRLQTMSVWCQSGGRVLCRSAPAETYFTLHKSRPFLLWETLPTPSLLCNVGDPP